jgi:hypothetical protein
VPTSLETGGFSVLGGRVDVLKNLTMFVVDTIPRNFGTEGCRFEPYRVQLFSRFENNTKTAKKTGLGAHHSKSSFFDIAWWQPAEC